VNWAESSYLQDQHIERSLQEIDIVG